MLRVTGNTSDARCGVWFDDGGHKRLGVVTVAHFVSVLPVSEWQLVHESALVLMAIGGLSSIFSRT